MQGRRPARWTWVPLQKTRTASPNEGRVLGGQKEGGGVEQEWMEVQLTTL